MAAVPSKDTSPELLVRRLAHALGYRFRLHARKLPGRPDLVFPKRRRVIFIHGCFWHGHRCTKGRLPKSRLDYWGPKIEENRKRDRRTLAALRRDGWKALVVWQCQTRDLERLSRLVRTFLGASRSAKTRTTRKKETH